MDDLLLELLNDYGRDAAADINDEDSGTEDTDKVGWFGWELEDVHGPVLTVHFRHYDEATDTTASKITKRYRLTEIPSN
jgi:hypothetical protein